MSADSLPSPAEWRASVADIVATATRPTGIATYPCNGFPAGTTAPVPWPLWARVARAAGRALVVCTPRDHAPMRAAAETLYCLDYAERAMGAMSPPAIGRGL